MLFERENLKRIVVVFISIVFLMSSLCYKTKAITGNDLLYISVAEGLYLLLLTDDSEEQSKEQGYFTLIGGVAGLFLGAQAFDEDTKKYYPYGAGAIGLAPLYLLGGLFTGVMTGGTLHATYRKIFPLDKPDSETGLFLDSDLQIKKSVERNLVTGESFYIRELR